MAKIFNLSQLSPARISAISSGACGSYTYNFNGVSISRLNRMSRGYDENALSILAGRVVIFESFIDDGGITRYKPIPEQFTEAERAIVEGGSFSEYALRNNLSYIANNALFSWKAICLGCGKKFATMPDHHECGEVECDGCGAILTTEQERGARMCKACKLKRLARIYDYHHRPNRLRPLFERKDDREERLHLGAEIEIDGYNRATYFGEEEASAFSSLFNADPFNAFIEFERDGSLTRGIECITAPTTFDGFWKRRKAFNAFYEKAREFGGSFGKVNGVHFHLDRDFFGRDAEEAGKASVLIELMVYKFYDFFSAISRRERGRFSYAVKKDGVNGLFSAFSNVYNQAHSYAVNGSSDNTIELRFFGGHIATGDDFLACADIAQAIARWAKNTTLAQADKATPADIVKYVRKCENVLAFIEGAIAERPITTAGEAGIEAFKTALKKRIDKANGEAI